MSSQKPQPSEPLDSRCYRIVTLTDRRPVRIVDDEWPEIARSEFEGCQKEQLIWGAMIEPEGKSATYSAKAKLIVRRHADCRFLVYGTYSVNCVVTKIHAVFTARHGEILPKPLSPVDGSWMAVIDAIRRVVHSLVAVIPASRNDVDLSGVQDLSLKCISNLPAQDLTGGEG